MNLNYCSHLKIHFKSIDIENMKYVFLNFLAMYISHTIINNGIICGINKIENKIISVDFVNFIRTIKLHFVLLNEPTLNPK